MPAGCMNPGAVNFDPAATEDDGSCVYLEKVDGICYEFSDYSTEDVESRGFTMSFALEADNWVFFHDYVPDFYFHTREKLHAVKNSNIYTMNDGPTGEYFSSTPNSFFIDVVFRFDDERTLDSLNWISEVIATNQQDQEFSTLTHITIWNSYQTSGRISIAQFFDGMLVENIRRTQSKWSFNDFRDIVATRGNKFIKDIFHDFAVDTTEVNTNLPWWEKKTLEDNYFIVRFEFDNTSNNVVLLHDVEANTTRSAR